MGKEESSFDGTVVKMKRKKYFNFKNNGCSCVSCGLMGKFFALERHLDTEVYHLNLYGIDEHGHEVLMTVDHKVPVSRGGKNNLSNLQTMCKVCNENKADNIFKKRTRKSSFRPPSKNEFEIIKWMFTNIGYESIAKSLEREEVNVGITKQDRRITAMVVIQNLVYQGFGNTRVAAIESAIYNNKPFVL